MSYETLLQTLARHDERLIVMTAENRAAIRGLPKLLGDRFVDVGIAEQTLIGTAVGLALRGRIPVVHALAAFLTMRAFEFIRTDVGVGGLPVKMVGAVPGFLSEANGPTHQAIEDVSIMRGIPSVNVFCPADEEDLLIGLPHILESPHPFYIRYTNMAPVYSHDRRFEIGVAELVKKGTDITILTYGTLFGQVLLAAEKLESEGLSVRLLNMRTLKPIDEGAVIDAALETSMIVTVEDHFVTGGLFSVVAELFGRRRMRPHTILPLALENRWFKPALFKDVLQYEGFTGDRIAEKIIDVYQGQQVHVLLKKIATR